MKWKIIDKAEDRTGVEGVVRRLLINRGVETDRARKEYLEPTDPMKAELWERMIKGDLKRGLVRAEERIIQAIKHGEEIVIYGDYDTDGVCATAVLWEVLNDLGAKVWPYIPERFGEGYGLNVDSVKKLVKERLGLKLVITVDNGIVAGERIREIGSLVDVIVTDHHQLSGKKPRAVAVVHTTELSGSGVSWLLAFHLYQMVMKRKWPGVEKIDLREKLGLAAIGTVADLLALVGVNRSLVKWGIDELRKTKRVGITYLCEKAGVVQKEIDAYLIGFVLAPRLNAMGRMEQAMESLRLICTRKKDRAEGLAGRLQEVNRRRQEVLEETTERAREVWSERKGKLIFVSDEAYHEGVIGLVAGKLVEEYWLPAVVVSKGEKYSKASARSIAGLNIIEAIMEVKEELVDAGGHPMAAGFTVETEKLSRVEKKLAVAVEKRLTEEILQRQLRVDMMLPFEALTDELGKGIEVMAPFGLGNPQPVFVTGGAEVREVRLVGNMGQHLKLCLVEGGREMNAIGFGMGARYDELVGGGEVEVAYNLVIEEWQGRRKRSLRLKDFHVTK